MIYFSNSALLSDVRPILLHDLVADFLVQVTGHYLLSNHNNLYPSQWKSII